ncbi:MAG: hypothetical protein HWD62_18535 [Cyclobacteriaceae bacterium]|nr:MAG: hypothetical protein HWD62_18535 [Cyclobacteriaceae bacterium]
MLRCLTFLIMNMFLALFSHAQITSTFDTDAEGWTLSDNNLNDLQTVNYFSAGGNRAGMFLQLKQAPANRTSGPRPPSLAAMFLISVMARI